MTIIWILLISIVVVALWAQLMRDILHDGRGSSLRPPTSHFEDPQFLPPSRV